MLGKDLLLDENHDLVIENFDLKMTDNSQIVAQRVKQQLLTLKGEWFLDSELGVPYLEILGSKNALAAAKAILTSHIMRVEGVKEIIAIKMKEDREQRVANFRIEIRDIFNNDIELYL